MIETPAIPALATALRRLVPFGRIGEAELAGLLANARVRKAARGEILIDAGDTTRTHAYLLDGEVALVAGGSEVERVRANSGAGRCPIAHRFPRPVSVRSVTPVTWLTIDSTLVDRLDAGERAGADVEVAEFDMGSMDREQFMRDAAALREQLSSVVSQAREAMGQEQTRVHAVRERETALREAYQAAQEELAETGERLRSMEQSIVTDRIAIEQERARHAEEIAARDMELAQARDELKAAQEREALLRDEHAALAGGFDTVARERDMLADEVDGIAQERDAARGEIERLKPMVAELRAVIEAYVEKLSFPEDQGEAVAALRGELEIVRAEAAEEIERLRSALVARGAQAMPPELNEICAAGAA